MQSSVLLPALSRPAPPAGNRRPDDNQDLNTFLPSSTLRKCKAKEHLFLEGDDRRFLFEVQTGAIALYKIAPDGRRQILRFALPGDLIGLDWDETEQLSAQATNDCVVRVVPFAAVLRAADDSPILRRKLGEAMVREMMELRAHITAVCTGGATQRVAFLLNRLVEKCGQNKLGGIAVELPVTRSDMGDYLGLTLETVSREISRLKAIGVIHIDRITHVTVKDIRRLKNLIEGDDFGCGRMSHALA